MKALAACLLFSGAAQAAVFGEVPTDGGRIDLHDDAGNVCVGISKAATYTPKSGKPIGGCWIIHQGNIQAIFFDGDAVLIPVGLVKQPTRL